jgi:paraquat-inducible protein B
MMDNPPDSAPPEIPPDAPEGPSWSAQSESIQTARIEARRRFSLVWLIPLVAAVIAAWLGWRTLAREGPTITISFNTASGLTAGQTKVEHKNVDLGTVRSIGLSRDMSHAVVRVAMRREAERMLTEHARFWVVRPRLTATSITGLETLISGAYIELDPGPPGGEPKRDFVGLEQPPAVRSDEPGRTFTLDADRLGSLGVGSPVLYRDDTVGEVISTTPGSPDQRASLRIFVKAPYFEYVRDGSYFWNDSGVSFVAGAEGFNVQIESIQALLSGAVGFDTPAEALATPAAAEDLAFKLFPDRKVAAASHYRRQVAFLVNFHGSVRGLMAGAPVELYGIQVGNVTDVKLQVERRTGTPSVQVGLAVQPERIFPKDDLPSPEETLSAMRELVQRGFRAQLRSANLLTGQLLVALDFFPDAPPAQVSVEGSAIVLPGQPGGLENLTRSIDEIVEKLDRLPLQQVAENLNVLLRSLGDTAPQLKSALTSAAEAMKSARELVDKLDAGATPMLRRLPEIAANLQSTTDRANKLIGSLNNQFGGTSDLPHQLARMMAQLDETARSIRTLADFLDQHPEALLRGRSGAIRER